MSNSEQFDLDIENYTITELRDLLLLEEDFNEEDVRQSIKETMKPIDNDAIDKTYIEFLKDAEFKLLTYLDEKSTLDKVYNEGLESLQEKVLQKELKKLDETRYNILTNPHVIENDSNIIIQKRSPTVMDNFANIAPTGIINPIRRKTVTQMINIDTMFRKNPSSTRSTNFLYTLPVPMNNVISMKLSAIEIPNVWNVYSSHNRTNEFTISIYNATGVTDNPAVHNITIPDGNYTSGEIVTIMNNYFFNTKNGLDFLNFSVDSYTGQVIIRARGGSDPGPSPKPFDPLDIMYSENFSFTVDFSVGDRNINQNCGWSFGFRDSVYHIGPDDIETNIIDQQDSVTYKAVLRSEGVYGSSVYQYIFLAVNDFNNSMKNSVISENDNSYLGDNILGRVTISSGSNTLVLDNGSDQIFKSREFFGPVKIEKMNIKLLDKFGNELNLNNNDYSIALEFTQIYS